MYSQSATFQNLSSRSIIHISKDVHQFIKTEIKRPFNPFKNPNHPHPNRTSTDRITKEHKNALIQLENAEEKLKRGALARKNKYSSMKLIFQRELLVLIERGHGRYPQAKEIAKHLNEHYPDPRGQFNLTNKSVKKSNWSPSTCADWLSDFKKGRFQVV